MMAHEETTDVEGTPSLLLSSLRFWEVEHDLIEERLTAIHERQQRRLFATKKPRLRRSPKSNRLC
jgi:hypothetical protein